MKKLIFFLLCISFFWNSSCKKDPYKDKTVIEGYMLEYGSEKPLSNVTVFLKRIEGEVFGPSFWVVVDSLHSDENGYVYYEYNHHNTTIDACTFVTPDQYYSVDLNSINTARVNDITKYFDPFAWLEIHLKNVNPFNHSDRIRYTSEYGLSWENEYGIDVDKNVLIKIRGNKSNYLLWKITKNNFTEEFEDSIIGLSNDTIPYEIFY